jgi:hypothetical protein
VRERVGGTAGVILGAAPASIAGGGDRNQVAAVDLGIFFSFLKCVDLGIVRERNFCFCFSWKLLHWIRRPKPIILISISFSFSRPWAPLFFQKKKLFSFTTPSPSFHRTTAA